MQHADWKSACGQLVQRGMECIRACVHACIRGQGSPCFEAGLFKAAKSPKKSPSSPVHFGNDQDEVWEYNMTEAERKGKRDAWRQIGVNLEKNRKEHEAEQKRQFGRRLYPCQALDDDVVFNWY